MGDSLLIEEKNNSFNVIKVGYPFPHKVVFPKKWEVFNFEEVVNITGGSQPPKSFFTNEKHEGYIRLIQIRDYKSDKYVVYIPKDKARRFCSKDDIMIGRYGPPIFQILRGLEGAYNVALMKAEPIGDFLNKEYLYYYLRHPNLFKYIDSGSHRTSGQTGVNKEYLKNYPFPLPPLPEQKRIVVKLDKMFGELEVLKTSLANIPVLMKNFRQAVLTQAVTGKLTEEWRVGKELGEYLNVIQENRKLDFDKRVKEAKREGERKPKKLDETEFELNVFQSSYECPENWKLANLKNIADFITDGEHSTPKRTDEGYYLLSARNVQNGWVSLEKVDYVPKEEYLRLKKRCNPEEKDILISCSGTIGRVSCVPANLEFVMVRSAALLKLQSNVNISKYLEFILRSDLIQSQMFKLQKSTAQANLFLGPIGKIVVPIPPKKEQEEIVRRVESLFEKADTIEKSYAALKEKIDTLPQAILAKAFRGELVEQLPTDGSAAELLEEIKKLKEELKGEKKTSKKKPKTK